MFRCFRLFLLKAAGCLPSPPSCLEGSSRLCAGFTGPVFRPGQVRPHPDPTGLASGPRISARRSTKMAKGSCTLHSSHTRGVDAASVGGARAVGLSPIWAVRSMREVRRECDSSSGLSGLSLTPCPHPLQPVYACSFVAYTYGFHRPMLLLFEK